MPDASMPPIRNLVIFGGVVGILYLLLKIYMRFGH